MLSPSRRASGVQAFSKPPRRLSKKILPTDFTFGSPIRKQISPTQNLSNTPEGQLALELGNATRDAEMDANLDDGPDNPFANEDLLEPDLPPTPTQLGLEKAPDRPRGLLSSSPSTRQERRMKRRATDALHGSPLKSLKFQTPDVVEVLDDPDLALGELPTAVLQKRESRNRLAAELRQLEKDVAELTNWTERVESRAHMGRDAEELKRFLTLLSEESSHVNQRGTRQSAPSVSSLLSTLLPFPSKAPRSAREASPLPTNPFALKEPSQSPDFLTVFAPLVLHAKTSRTSSSTSTILETHTLTFSAPPPFPASIFNVSVVYETNPETQSITSLSVSTGNDSKKRKVPEALRRWIDSRLANPLLRLDVATICWGINRHWEVSVARARIWARIEHRHFPRRNESDVLPQMQEGTISISELRQLIPHLERSTMVVGPKPSKPGTQVLLSNAVAIDEWTGEPQLRSDVSVSVSGADNVSSKKVDHEAKKLFHTLLRGESASVHGFARAVHTDVILRATDGVLGALFGSA